MATPFFELAGVRRTFGGLVAVNDLSFAIDAGSIVAMIGPNGAGKSTVFNLITGIYRPTAGTIALEGRVLAGLPTDRITALGIARTFQNIRLFAFMSALDNVMTGRHARMHASMFDSIVHSPRQRAEERRESASARASSCASWTSKRARTTMRATSPTVASAASRSRARSPPIRSSCCSTSRRPA
jgi:ABC-type branched-subunit amino acid transport system ATPase component